MTLRSTLPYTEQNIPMPPALSPRKSSNDHTACPSHCCKHHCKYGYDDCPVVLGIVPQEFTYECCDEEDQNMLVNYKGVIAHLISIGKINLASELTNIMKQINHGTTK